MVEHIQRQRQIVRTGESFGLGQVMKLFAGIFGEAFATSRQDGLGYIYTGVIGEIAEIQLIAVTTAELDDTLHVVLRDKAVQHLRLERSQSANRTGA